jgi:hypothetical protein
MARVRKRKIHPQHSVNMQLNAWDLAKAGSAATFKVSNRDGLLLTIEIGQGTFGWKTAYSKRPFERVSWTKLAAMLDDA